MPERIEDYEVLGVIGTGSFGTCYKVRKKKTPHVFVWKAVDYGSMSEERKKLLVSEVNVLRELRHPNIVRYYDRILHKESATIYIIMEWCEGGDLAALIKKCRRAHAFIDEAFVWRTLYQISCALKACHGPGRPVLHRDIKPANLFLDSQFNIKLGDFGLVRVLNCNELKKGGIDECYAETVVGTPFYMSPEVVKGSKYNCKSDVWSLGCVIYELCSLNPPFSCHDVNVLTQRIKDGKFSKVPSHYSEELHKIIVFMLTVDQDIRPCVETILHHPSIITRTPQWAPGKSNSCNLRIPIKTIKPIAKPLDETFCSCENDCCEVQSAPLYAEIRDPGGPNENGENAISQSYLAKHKSAFTVNAPELSIPPFVKTIQQQSKSNITIPLENLAKSMKSEPELRDHVTKENAIVAERLEILRQREVKLRMKELALDERERTVRRKEKEAALASRIARETMGRASVFLKTCKNGRRSVTSTVTGITMRSRSPSDNAPSLPDADSSLDQEHGDTSTIAKTSTKLDPRSVCKPAWSTARKVTFDLKGAPQVIDGFPQDPSIIDNTRNAGILSAVNGKASSTGRPSSWSTNYYWLDPKKHAFREKNVGKENKFPGAKAVNQKAPKKNVLLPQASYLSAPGMVHSQFL